MMTNGQELVGERPRGVLPDITSGTNPDIWSVFVARTAQRCVSGRDAVCVPQLTVTRVIRPDRLKGDSGWNDAKSS